MTFISKSISVSGKVRCGVLTVGGLWTVEHLTFGDFHSGGLARRLFGGEVKCEWLTVLKIMRLNYQLQDWELRHLLAFPESFPLSLLRIFHLQSFCKKESSLTEEPEFDTHHQMMPP